MRQRPPNWPPGRVLLDLDGVCYLRGTPIPGAADAVRAIAQAGSTVAYLTNNSWERPAYYADVLCRLGFPAGPEQVITSAQAAVAVLQTGGAPGIEALRPGASVATMGGPGITEALATAGYAPVPVEQAMQQAPAALVVGVDFEATYSRISAAATLARSGIPFVATNLDATYPTESGLQPGAGAIVAAVAAASGTKPVVAGKPEEAMADAARKVAGHGGVMVIGDRIETDIAFATRWGFASGLVLTGAASVPDLVSANFLPDFIGLDLASVLEAPLHIRRGEGGHFVVEGGDEVLRSEVAAVLRARA